MGLNTSKIRSWVPLLIVLGCLLWVGNALQGEAQYYGAERLGWFGGLRWGTSEAENLFNFAESVFPHLPRDQEVVFWSPGLSRVAGEDCYRWASYYLFDVEIRFLWQAPIPESTHWVLTYGEADPGASWETLYHHQRGRLWHRP